MIYVTFIQITTCFSQERINRPFHDVTDTTLQIGVYNSSLLSQISQHKISIGYQNHYFIKELNTVSITGAFASNVSPIALSFTRYGTEFYNTQSASFATGKTLFNNIAVGIKYSQNFISTSENSYKSSIWRAGTSLSYKPIENILIGLTYNFGSIVNYYKLIKFDASLGLRYIFTNAFSGSIQLSNNNLDINTIQGIVYYRAHNIFEAKAGISNSETNLMFGCSFFIKSILISLTTNSHRRLGNSFYTGVTYRF